MDCPAIQTKKWFHFCMQKIITQDCLSAHVFWRFHKQHFAIKRGYWFMNKYLLIVALKQNPMVPVQARCLYMRLWGRVDCIFLIPRSFPLREDPRNSTWINLPSQIKDMVSNINVQDKRWEKKAWHWCIGKERTERMKKTQTKKKRQRWKRMRTERQHSFPQHCVLMS